MPTPLQRPRPGIDREHGTALLNCLSCGRTFETGLTPAGGIRFDGVRMHGATQHPTQASWQYELVERAGSA